MDFKNISFGKIYKKYRIFVNMEKEEHKNDNLVKRTCKELGITQKELAKETGFSEDSISKWNNGAKLPKSATRFFIKLMELYHIKSINKSVNQINSLYNM